MWYVVVQAGGKGRRDLICQDGVVSQFTLLARIDKGSKPGEWGLEMQDRIPGTDRWSLPGCWSDFHGAMVSILKLTS